eukprot:339380-Amphidinium_carterae.1
MTLTLQHNVQFTVQHRLEFGVRGINVFSRSAFSISVVNGVELNILHMSYVAFSVIMTRRST